MATKKLKIQAINGVLGILYLALKLYFPGQPPGSFTEP
jgi:hypothetical protein